MINEEKLTKRKIAMRAAWDDVAQVSLLNPKSIINWIVWTIFILVQFIAMIPNYTITDFVECIVGEVVCIAIMDAGSIVTSYIFYRM